MYHVHTLLQKKILWYVTHRNKIVAIGKNATKYIFSKCQKIPTCGIDFGFVMDTLSSLNLIYSQGVV